MAKEKIFYKKLPWSPALVGQPVGPLKGACVRACATGDVYVCMCAQGTWKGGLGRKQRRRKGYGECWQGLTLVLTLAYHVHMNNTPRQPVEVTSLS